MQIQFNTDNQIDGPSLEAQAHEIVESVLGRFSGRITRLEVHLQDENADKGGADDIRCAMEARPDGLRPIAATHNDASADAAVRGAARKLYRALETEFGKRDAHR
jgi:hypothetical protein